MLESTDGDGTGACLLKVGTHYRLTCSAHVRCLPERAWLINLELVSFMICFVLPQRCLGVDLS